MEAVGSGVGELSQDPGPTVVADPLGCGVHPVHDRLDDGRLPLGFVTREVRVSVGRQRGVDAEGLGELGSVDALATTEHVAYRTSGRFIGDVAGLQHPVVLLLVLDVPGVPAEDLGELRIGRGELTVVAGVEEKLGDDGVHHLLGPSETPAYLFLDVIKRGVGETIDMVDELEPVGGCGRSAEQVQRTSVEQAGRPRDVKGARQRHDDGSSVACIGRLRRDLGTLLGFSDRAEGAVITQDGGTDVCVFGVLMLVADLPGEAVPVEHRERLGFG